MRKRIEIKYDKCSYCFPTNLTVVGEVLLFRVGLSNTERLYAKVDPGRFQRTFSSLCLCTRSTIRHKARNPHLPRTIEFCP